MNDIVKFSQFGQAQALSGAERIPFQSGSINAVFTLTQLTQFIRQSLGLGDAATASKTDFDAAGVAAGVNTLSTQRDDALSERLDHLQQDIDNAKNGANSYRTLALAQAAVAAGDIPANTSLRVTLDPDTTKNGLYDYNGLTLAKSSADELTQAKAYADANPLFKPIGINSGDVNNILLEGFYYITSAVLGNILNLPILRAGSLIVFGTGSLRYQLFKPINGSEFYFRSGNGGSSNFAFLLWQRFATGAEIDSILANTLVVPKDMTAGEDCNNLTTGIRYIADSTIAATILNLPPGTQPLLGTIKTYRRGAIGYQRFIRYNSTEQWERAGNGGSSSFAWNDWEKIVRSSDLTAFFESIAAPDKLNSALANSTARPNLLTQAQVDMTTLPITTTGSIIEKATLRGKTVAKVSASGSGTYPTIARAFWLFAATTATFPSGFMSVQLTVDETNAGTVGSIALQQKDGSGATLSNTVITTELLSATSESKTYIAHGIPVAAGLTRVDFVFSLEGTGRYGYISNPLICDGKSGYWRNPKSTVAPSLTLNLFPNTSLTSASSTLFQAIHTLEDGYDVATMTSGLVSQLYYELDIGGIWRIGDTVTFSSDVFTDVANGSGTTSADIGLVFLDSAGATLGTIPRASSSAANAWNTLSINGVIPANTVKIRMRFVHRNIGQLSKFRSPKLATSNPSASVLSPSMFGSTSSTSKTLVFVSTTGSDNNDGATASSAFATFAKALAVLGNSGGTIEILGGEYRQSINVTASSHVWLRSARGQRAKLFGSDKLVATKTSGFSQVYQAPLAAKPVGMGAPRGLPVIFEYGTPSKPVLEEDRHFLHRGRTHRLPYTEMFEAATKAELDTVGGRGKWFWESGVIYFAATDGSDATLKRYEARMRPVLAQSLGSIRLTRIDGYFSNSYGMDFQGISTKREDCRVFGSFHDGFSDDANFTESYRDESGGNGNDGFNGTVTDYASKPDEETRIEAVYFDPYSHDNGDDGLSYHVRGGVTIYGGLMEYNTKADVVHVTGANCVCYNTVAQGTENGFYAATASPDSRTKTVMRCVGTKSRKNGYSYRAADDSALNCENALAENPTIFGYYQTGTGSLNAKNCKYTGDSAKTKSGNVIVTNDAALV